MKVFIKTKKRVFGNLIGRYISTFKGNGLDFKEFREYTPFDDAKKIDWKISAKVNKPLVKEFNEERELRIILAVLKSGSLYFGSNRLKIELISEIITFLGLLAIKYDNKVQSIFLGNKNKIFKPTKTYKGVYAFATYALNTNYLKEDYKEIEFLNKFKKSILFLIGDFYKPINFHKLKHETYIINVRDKFEEAPTFKGEIEVIDPITLNNLNINFNKHSIQKISSFIKQIDNELIIKCKKYKIPYTKIYTDEDFVFKLEELLK